MPGLQAGINLLRLPTAKTKYGLCEETNKNISSILSLGLKGKISYFELFQPFGELGLAKAFCYSKALSKISKEKKTIKPLLFLWLFFEFKNFG